MEQQRELAEQQRGLAEQQRELAEAFRQLQRKQRSSTQTHNTLLSAMLHDEALQRLAGVVQELRQAQQAGASSAELTVLVQECVAIDYEIRRVLRDLRPRGYGQPLAETLEDAISRGEQDHRSVSFDYRLETLPPSLSEFQRTSIVLVVSQAVENALEHANPRHITVVLRQAQAAFLIEVRDDGRGFHYAQVQASKTNLGLLLMQDIAEELGGRLEVQTQSGEGCRIILSIPLPEHPKVESPGTISHVLESGTMTIELPPIH